MKTAHDPRSSHTAGEAWPRSVSETTIGRIAATTMIGWVVLSQRASRRAFRSSRVSASASAAGPVAGASDMPATVGHLVATTEDVLVFFLGLLGFEVGLNLLSARLQAALAMAGPQFAGKWLTATILLGAAVGPPLHGAALGLGSGLYFLVFALLSAFLPYAWWKSCRLEGQGA